MKHEKIIKREDGTNYRIDVFLHIHMLGKHDYTVEVWEKQPRKRTWNRTCDSEDYAFRRLSLADRQKFEDSNNLKFVTEAEILEAKRELWEKLKPM